MFEVTWETSLHNSITKDMMFPICSLSTRDMASVKVIESTNFATNYLPTKIILKWASILNFYKTISTFQQKNKLSLALFFLQSTGCLQQCHQCMWENRHVATGIDTTVAPIRLGWCSFWASEFGPTWKRVFVGGGFKDFWNFHPKNLGKMNPFLTSRFFRRGWNHQFLIGSRNSWYLL